MHIFCPSPHTQTIIVTNDRKYQTCLIIGFCDRNNKKSEIGLRAYYKYLSRITSARAKFASVWRAVDSLSLWRMLLAQSKSRVNKRKIKCQRYARLCKHFNNIAIDVAKTRAITCILLNFFPFCIYIHLFTFFAKCALEYCISMCLSNTTKIKIFVGSNYISL